jgi:Amt family ammonium transporter
MDTNAVLDLMWVVICGILVFSCKLVSHLWKLVFKIKKRWEYNNENLMDFASVLSDFGLSVTLSCTEILLDLYRKSKLFFDSVADMHSLFFQTVFAPLPHNVSGAIAERTKFSTYLIFSLMMTVLYTQFLALGLARRRLVN